MNTVTVYTKPSCVQCNATYRGLTARGVNYNTVDVTKNEAAAQLCRDLEHKTAPVVVITDPAGNMVANWSGYVPPLLDQHFGAVPRKAKAA